MKVELKQLSGKTTLLYVKPQLQVEEVKREIQQILGIAYQQQILLYKGKQLENDRELCDYNIQNGDQIYLVIRLREE